MYIPTTPDLTARILAESRVSTALLIVIALAVLGVADSATAQSHPYQKSDAITRPVLFAPGIVSTDAIEYSPAFVPDGTAIYFTRRSSWRENPSIYVSHYRHGSWQEPVVTSFSGTFSDEYPSLTSDGKRLYFASKRPINGPSPQTQNDIWFVEKTQTGWSEAKHLPAPINSEHVESAPYVSESGILYFHSNRPGSTGVIDIYQTHAGENGYSEPIPVSFNSSRTDGEVIDDPNRRFIIFYSDRSGSRGRGSLFIVHHDDGERTMPIILGEEINPQAYEWTPTISPDGKYLFYAYMVGSDSDIMQVNLDSVVSFD